MALSDRVAVFSAGELQQYAAPREIYERPANLFVAEFMGLLNKVAAEVVGERDGHPLVRFAGQTLVATAGPHGAPGSGATTLAIRPEAIRLDAAPDALNVLAGTIREATFLGNVIDYEVEVAGQRLRVQTDRRRFHEAGTAVRLEIPPEDCVVMAQ
jgi:ABC-type Fe3+/spermidine/putrescine transport system ATPase subunit